MSDDRLRQVEFSAMNPLRSPNSSAFAATRVLSPFLGQVQPRISQTDSIPSAQRAKYSNLAKAISSIYSPAPNNAFALLATRSSLAENPREVSQKILQHLIVAVRNRFDHALRIALLRPHRHAQIPLGRFSHAMLTGAQLLREVDTKSLEPFTEPFERFAALYPSLGSRFGEFQHGPVRYNRRHYPTKRYDILAIFKC
jgi:hypothetical protein